LRYLAISKATTLLSVRRNSFAGVELARAAAVATVGIMVHVGSALEARVAAKHEAVTVFVALTTERVYLVSVKV
jgi:hypothetical protein